MRSSYGVARYVAAEGDVLAGPTTGYGHPGTVTGVVWCHGVGGNALYAKDLSKVGAWPLFHALAEKFMIVSADLGGDTWGNATANTRVGQAITYLQAQGAKAGKVALVGLSMGAVVALNYAREFPGNVSCVAAIIPVVDIEDVRANNRSGLAASINAAHGGAYDQATMGATRNPVTFASTLNLPVKIWNASDDTTALASRVAAFDAAAPNCDVVSLGALGHTEAAIAAATPSDVISWLQAHS